MKNKNLKVYMILVLSALALFIASGCSSGSDAETTEDITIVEKGISPVEDGYYSYYIVVQNNTDKILKKAFFEVEAYDENGGKLKPLTEDAKYGGSGAYLVNPGEKMAFVEGAAVDEKDLNDSAYICFSGVPADLKFKLYHKEFKKDDGTATKLRIVDHDEGSVDDSGKNIWYKVRVANTGDTDFICDEENLEAEIHILIISKDEDGNYAGASLASVPGDQSKIVIKAGEEKDLEFSADYIPGASQDLYMDAHTYAEMEE